MAAFRALESCQQCDMDNRGDNLVGRCASKLQLPFVQSGPTPAGRRDGKAMHSGAALNVQSDYHLLHLRAEKGAGYHIPTGGAFQMVSCPNFLGEILEWTGYAIACRHIAGFAFAWCASTPAFLVVCCCYAFVYIARRRASEAHCSWCSSTLKNRVLAAGSQSAI